MMTDIAQPHPPETILRLYSRIPTTAFNADRLTPAGIRNTSLHECERYLVSYSVYVTIIGCAGIERDGRRSEHDRVPIVSRSTCLPDPGT